MNAAVSVREQGTAQKLDAWLNTARARYDLLVSAAKTPERRAELARLGAKYCELRAMVQSHGVSERDAASAPRLASWLASQLGEYERASASEPLPITHVPADDPFRAAALRRVASTFRREFGYAPGHVAVLRLDALLARYPREAVANALIQSARREGHLQWEAVAAHLCESELADEADYSA
ncbi:MAG: hypothetical protein JWO59_1066 [Chloroflexi bacterium]|nr:hypothetical protein [Chloroflexota bacterium]MDB5076988.1 hypothetical protein [Chloroflexota bacterium]